ncbi:MAG: selenium-dependent molybdenum cofactor biosynthesis protein YqeB [Anaerolineales bacterium]
MTPGPRVLLRGGGDLATGVAARLHRAGFSVLVTEIEQPLAVRRLVSLAEAVYQARVTIEDLIGRRVDTTEDADASWRKGEIPVMVDPPAASRVRINPLALIDARMRKKPPEIGREAAPLVVGLGPGFQAGQNCHAVVETNRGHHLGRVFWTGQAEADTGVPGTVKGYDVDRVLRAPADGEVQAETELGTVVDEGHLIATVGGAPLEAPFRGALRGLIHDGLSVKEGTKIGDLDPRAEPSYCFEISDKALSVGGGVLEALLSRRLIRQQLAG